MPKKFHLASRLIVSSLKVLCIVLRRLSYPGRLRDLQTFFPRHHTTLSRIFNFGLYWISEKTHHLIDTLQQPFLTRERMDQYAAVIANESGHLSRGMRIFAFIDGTFKQTCRPDKDQRVIYNGKDRHHGLKYQGITAPNGLILHLAGPLEGARHDAYTYLESSIEDALRAKNGKHRKAVQVVRRPVLYTLSNFLITPFRKDELHKGEIDFNQIMARRTYCC
ncbi:hypothetical protein BV898_14618 [Hypsibius exemplaris]|uniref:DDE Tnp4 domain-containing protein n=1 Tax=Hypsibius exemplaris TaxID=2072580 RepID=A0A9X6RJN7_HYPEX|nr:hypothetical protein BV898_14618 [Hypsibius exemplaris]